MRVFQQDKAEVVGDGVGQNSGSLWNPVSHWAAGRPGLPTMGRRMMAAVCFSGGGQRGRVGGRPKGQTIRKLYVSLGGNRRRGDGEGELKCGERVHSEAAGECRVAMGGNGAM